MKAKEVLQKTLARMTPDNWFQGDLNNNDGSKHCVMGHMMSIENWQTADIVGARKITDKIALEYFGIIIPENDEEICATVALNDDPHSSFEDVVLMLKYAIEECEKNGS